MSQLFEPSGFRSCSKWIGIKTEALDFTVIYSSVRSCAAAMFTRNRFCGPSVLAGKRNVADGWLQAIVVTSGIANVATGDQGIRNVEQILNSVAAELGVAPDDVLFSSTGVIGIQLPMDKLQTAISGLRNELVEGNLRAAAQAIMTTDSYPKIRSRKIGNAVLLGMSKGVGMIEPDMATMLSYFVTDALIGQNELSAMFRSAVNKSFNMISVDTDTSTSDTAAIMANGMAGAVDLAEFSTALEAMAIELARENARGGEGATKLIEVTVEGASSFDQAKCIAKSVVNSPLVKTAVFGADPNWGRIAMAIGKCHEYADIQPENISIAFGNIIVYQGHPVDNLPLDKLREHLNNVEINIRIQMGTGVHRATVWGCDLSCEYVRINSAYTT